MFASVDLKHVFLCSSLLDLRSCKCYHSITYNYLYAQPYSHSHTIDTLNTNVTRTTRYDRTREPATASPLLNTAPFFVFNPKTNAADKQRQLCNMIRGNFVNLCFLFLLVFKLAGRHECGLVRARARLARRRLVFFSLQ